MLHRGWNEVLRLLTKTNELTEDDDRGEGQEDGNKDDRQDVLDERLDQR